MTQHNYAFVPTPQPCDISDIQELIPSDIIDGKAPRKKPRRKQVFYDTAQAERVAITDSHEDTVIDLIDIQRAIGKLPTRQREVYLLTMSGKTREEIATLFKLTPRRIGQIQAGIYDTIDHALAVRLPEQSISPRDDMRQR